MPKLSVITVACNSLHDLKKTISSCQFLSNYVDFEHIIIDGASSDGTVDYLESLKEGNGLTWISENDRGIYDAMNKGISLAEGDYIQFLNAGDCYSEFDPQKLNEALCKGHDLVIAPVVLVGSDGVCFKEPIFPKVFCLESIRDHGTAAVNHQSIIIRKSKCPKYFAFLKLKGELNWYIDILKFNTALDVAYLDWAIVRYQVGGLGSQKVYWNLFEWILVVLFRFGPIQNFKNIASYRKFIRSHKKLQLM